MILEIPGDAEAATPDDGPIGKRRVRVSRLDLEPSPDGQHVVGQMETEVGEPGDRAQSCMAKDERSPRVGHGRS
jgi:hypothetical protein